MPDSKTETGFAFGTKAETLARLSAAFGEDLAAAQAAATVAGFAALCAPTAAAAQRVLGQRIGL